MEQYYLTLFFVLFFFIVCSFLDIYTVANPFLKYLDSPSDEKALILNRRHKIQYFMRGIIAFTAPLLGILISVVSFEVILDIYLKTILFLPFLYVLISSYYVNFFMKESNKDIILGSFKKNFYKIKNNIHLIFGSFVWLLLINAPFIINLIDTYLQIENKAFVQTYAIINGVCSAYIIFFHEKQLAYFLDNNKIEVQLMNTYILQKSIAPILISISILFFWVFST